MQKKHLVLILAVMAIVGAAVSLYFSNRTPPIDFSQYGSAGTVAAEETAKLIGGPGEIALYITDADESIPALKAQVDSFEKALMGKNIKVTVVEKIPTGGMSTELAPDQIAKTIAGHRGLKGIVTFVRLASLSNDDTTAIKDKGIKLIAISSYFPNYKKLLNAQLLHLAVVPRIGPPLAPAKKPKTVREQFEQTYQLLTPGNAAALP
jgi:hypothetical protein